jgi:polyisoprenoid-binding protein YceI
MNNEMKRNARYLMILIGLFMVGSIWAQGKWTVDPVHSKIGFNVTHLVISEVDGNFKTYSGTLIASKPDFTDAKIDFAVDVASISTDNDMRDKHLKSDDFFNAEKFPQMTFTSTSLTKIDGNKYALEGNLKIRDVIKLVKFDVVYGGTVKDSYGNTKAGFKATTTINRLDYGLKWNALTETGGAVVSPEVNIILNLEFALQK